MQGTVTAIYIAPQAAAPMQALAAALLQAGKGIAGDRYYRGDGTFSAKLRDKPDFEVTLIEAEQVDAFNARTGLDLDYGALRRNIVTRGVDLNALVGKTFRAGAVSLEGIRLCEPCAHIARLAAREIPQEMVHRAGLRARIVAGGQLRVGDAIA